MIRFEEGKVCENCQHEHTGADGKCTCGCG